MPFSNSLWQSPEWEKFQNLCGNETFRIEKQLIICRQMALGKTFAELPRVDLQKISSSFFDKLKAEAQQRGLVFARFFPEISAQEFPDGARSSGVPEIFPEETLGIDLSQSAEDILADMKQKGRYNIRLAEKKGVRIHKAREVDDFYQILGQTGERDGFAIHPRQTYANMLEAFGENGVLLLAEFEGTVIAGGIFLVSGETMTYYYGASDYEHRHLMAPYLVQWSAIEYAQKQNLKWYDFLGIAPEGAKNHRLSGVSRFKEKFGGMRISYPPAFEIVYSTKWDRFLRLAKKARGLFSR